MHRFPFFYFSNCDKRSHFRAVETHRQTALQSSAVIEIASGRGPRGDQRLRKSVGEVPFGLRPTKIMYITTRGLACEYTRGDRKPHSLVRRGALRHPTQSLRIKRNSTTILQVISKIVSARDALRGGECKGALLTVVVRVCLYIFVPEVAGTYNQSRLYRQPQTYSNTHTQGIYTLVLFISCVTY